MIKELMEMLKVMPRAKKVFYSLVLAGYIVGVIIGYSILKGQVIKRIYCIESYGPITCQPDEDCNRECLKYDYKFETREREAFYTYGLLGAFVGGWMAVLVITYLLKE